MNYVAETTRKYMKHIKRVRKLVRNEICKAFKTLQRDVMIIS